MKDIIRKGLVSGDISLTLLALDGVKNEAVRLHKTAKGATDALGRALTAGAFMAARLKSEGDGFSLTIKGGGSCGAIVVEGGADLKLKGCVDEPDADGAIEEVVGTNGRITVVRDLGFGEPYVGSCPIAKGNIEDDVAAYYIYSEQLPTSFVLFDGDGKSGAGGAAVQLMPGFSRESVAKAMDIYSQILEKRNGGEPFDLQWASGFFDSGFVDAYPVYECGCNEREIESVLLSMGKSELISAAEENGEVEVVCHFCNRRYKFTKPEIYALLERAEKTDK